MDLLEVAASSLALVNLQMARAIDIVSLERGYDPREFTLFAFGGAGPMHAAELADQVGIRSVIIPPLPGLFSALSMLMTDAKYAFVQGIVHALDDVSEQSLENEFSKLSEDAIAKLKERGVDLAGVSVKRTADLRYFGQGYELETEVGVPFSKKEAANAFEKKHEAVFGYRHAGEGVEITALRITLTIPIEKPKLGFPAQRHSDNRQVPDHRRVWFGGEWIDTAVLWRNDLEIDQTIQGPAIIEGYDSTIVVPPSWTIINTKTGCMFLRRCP
jgi:N-methylhydantoinase A